MKVASGEGLMSQPYKGFNEAFEKKVWKLVLDYCDKEKRTDGKEAYVVPDVSKLVVAIIEFYEKVQDQRFGKKKRI